MHDSTARLYPHTEGQTYLYDNFLPDLLVKSIIYY